MPCDYLRSDDVSSLSIAVVFQHGPMSPRGSSGPVVDIGKSTEGESRTRSLWKALGHSLVLHHVSPLSTVSQVGFLEI